MKSRKRAVALAGCTALVFFQCAHAGDIYKCKGADGVPVFQNTPCATSTQVLRHQTYQNNKKSSSLPSEAHIRAAVAALVSEHPDITYGQNAGLLQLKMNAIIANGITTRQLLDRAYREARASSAWQSTPSPSRSRTATRPEHQMAATPAPGLAVPRGGITGMSRYQSSSMHGYVCTKPDGSTYTASICGSTSIEVGTQHREIPEQQWAGYDERGRAVVDSGDHQGFGQVYDRFSGNMRDANTLRWEARTVFTQVDEPVYEDVPDKARAISIDQACDRAQAEHERQNTNVTAERVRKLCHSGRGMRDLRPSRGSLYYTPADKPN